jgi:energy-coupling factor transporter transmembrane protein EcfT
MIVVILLKIIKVLRETIPRHIYDTRDWVTFGISIFIFGFLLLIRNGLYYTIAILFIITSVILEYLPILTKIERSEMLIVSNIGVLLMALLFIGLSLKYNSDKNNIKTWFQQGNNL